MVEFAEVDECAQPFLAEAIIRHRKQRDGRYWILCETERAQEQFFSEFRTWASEALLFPSIEVAMVEGAAPDPEISAERLAVLQRLADPKGRFAVVLHRDSLDELVEAPAALKQLGLVLEAGQEMDRDQLLARLAGAGYEPVSQVTERGQFAVRGGILDVYSWQHGLPNRIEWMGDLIESVREFGLDDQSSVRSLERCSLLIGVPEGGQIPLRNYRKKADFTIVIGEIDEPGDVRIHAGRPEANGSAGAAFFPSALAQSGRGMNAPVLGDALKARVARELKTWLAEGYTLALQYWKEGELAAARKVLAEAGWPAEKLVLRESESSRGFVFPAGRLAAVTAGELLGHMQGPETRLRRMPSARALARAARGPIDFTELRDGELVIHIEHGLARYRGIELRRASGEDAAEEMLTLEFAEGARLFVPVAQAALVSRYVGLGRGAGVALSRLGDAKWSATKRNAEKAIYDYAAKLLEVQALREARHGTACGPDGAWQEEFEQIFPYRETPDQLSAIAATKADMESTRPMDRLICGDVGFGKTEVAIRAAFKAAADGRQVAVLVPTTVLAQQHFDNFRQRMTPFPLNVELLSRYRSAAEQAAVTEGLRTGSVDIVIGTHRLISRDMTFKKLGLLVVDEEQRFGVKHKERIKERFPGVDVLTLSATPIPRTLYMALTGARDLSTIETPPPNRYPIETVICAYDERVIRLAVERELERGGQVYFLHNRIETIERVASRILHLCPRARVDMGHGRMNEDELEQVMQRFVARETDVLVATTIIESGLDIPNANTIIIDRADRFGLADLYQLRGRVGRGEHKAYAYLMLPRDLITVGEARKRIQAIQQYSSLGAGFKIALRDLEIRGAGNILGVAQSGHLSAIGFDLYCQLLRAAVSKLRGEKTRPRVEAQVRLDFAALTEAAYLSRDGQGDEVWPAYLPAAYMEDSSLRIQAYRQFASVTGPAELEKLRRNWRDRFGPLPAPAENLLTLGRLRLAASKARVQQVEVREDRVILTRHGEPLQAGGRFPRLKSSAPGEKVEEIFDLLRHFCA
jgi:transcription-repair coupling factor (superfamily II helicase)